LYFLVFTIKRHTLFRLALTLSILDNHLFVESALVKSKGIHELLHFPYELSQFPIFTEIKIRKHLIKIHTNASVTKLPPLINTTKRTWIYRQNTHRKNPGML